MIYQGGKIQLQGAGRDVIEVEGYEYSVENLDGQRHTVAGPNSYVFLLRDPSGDEPDKVLKISKYYRPFPDPANPNFKYIRRRYGRFIQEIEALNRAKERGLTHIVEILGDGVWKSGNIEFPFYVMEKADKTLKEFVFSEPLLDEQSKLDLCRQLLYGVKELHSLNLYHRDLKPENIFVFQSGEGDRFDWKLADLGLVSGAAREVEDEIGERIGPFGWISPEVMNKYLTEHTHLGFDCVIDQASDIFQLGNIFWFIYQGNVPLGQIQFEDFRCEIVKEKAAIFGLIQDMVQHSKVRRQAAANIDAIERRLAPVVSAVGL